jgi:hypothetical protein
MNLVKKIQAKFYRRLSLLCYDLRLPILCWKFIGKAWDIERELECKK